MLSVEVAVVMPALGLKIISSKMKKVRIKMGLNALIGAKSRIIDGWFSPIF